MPACSTCGFESEGAFKFCPECGAEPVATTPSREQRKTVTVLFCDLTGSTALGETLDPERLRALLARYFERMKAIVERHGGSVEKFIGDAVMAVFGVPVLHEDDALRAVRAAIEMRDALPELGLQGRIGVMTGEVVTGTEERLATGDAVNVAARLEQAAQPGEVLIGQPTLALVHDAVEVGPVEPLELKGKAEPVPAYRLLRVRDAPERRHEELFVGRERELAILREAWDRVQAEQRCELVTVIGDAGVGKSRLAAEILASIEATVVRGRCLPYGEGITYWPVVEVLKQLDVLPPDEAAAVAIRSLLGETEAATSAEEIAWAFRKTLEEAAAERPLVVVFDDIHWGEETFLDLIEHVALLSSGASILLLCIARPELSERRPAWPVRLRLEPLGDEDVEELIPERIAGELREKITRAAGGNPLFIGEIVAMAQEAEGEVVVPPTLRALLAARLDQLETAERGVLERGAIEGEIFHRGAVQALAPEETQVTPRLAALVRKELIRPDKPQLAGEDGFRFRHLLIRDAAYDALPKATRAELHERFAAWLEEHGAELVELDEILGYHLEQAYRYRTELGPVGEGERQLSEKAGRRLASAGGRAVARSDIRASVNLLSRAVALLGLDDPLRLGIMSDLGWALAQAGDLEGARGVLGEALERAEAAGDDRLRAHATMQRWLALGEGDITEARREAEQALDVFEAAGDERGLSRAWQVLGDLDFADGQAEASERALERALVHARNAGDAGQQTAIYAFLSVVLIRGPTPAGEGIRRCEEVLAETRGNRTIAAVMFHALAHLRARRGEFEEALSLAERCRNIHRENGAMWNFWVLTEIIWDIKMLAGELGDALEILTEGYEHVEQMGETNPLLAAFLGQSLYADGQFEAAQRRAELAAASEDALSRNSGRGVLAKVLARQGRLEEAELMAREAVAFFKDTEFSIDQTNVLMDLAEVLRLAGRPEEAVSTIRDAIDLYERKEDIVSAVSARKLIDDLAGSANLE